MYKLVILYISFFTLLFSCQNNESKKVVDLKEKAIQLITEKYSTAYVSTPVFLFNNDLVKYEKNKPGAANDYIHEHITTVDENIKANIGYILKYIATIDGYTFIFVASFDNNLQMILSNSLYKNALYSSDIVDIDSISIYN